MIEEIGRIEGVVKANTLPILFELDNGESYRLLDLVVFRHPA